MKHDTNVNISKNEPSLKAKQEGGSEINEDKHAYNEIDHSLNIEDTSVGVDNSQILPAPVTTDDTQTPQSTTKSNIIQAPAIADDNDLIEKDWIDKAKAILARHKEDPHAQNKEMSSYKADYMKKRYNKDIKTTEPK